MQFQEKNGKMNMHEKAIRIEHTSTLERPKHPTGTIEKLSYKSNTPYLR